MTKAGTRSRQEKGHTKGEGGVSRQTRAHLHTVNTTLRQGLVELVLSFLASVVFLVDGATHAGDEGRSKVPKNQLSEKLSSSSMDNVLTSP